MTRRTEHTVTAITGPAFTLLDLARSLADFMTGPNADLELIGYSDRQQVIMTLRAMVEARKAELA